MNQFTYVGCEYKKVYTTKEVEMIKANGANCKV